MFILKNLNKICKKYEQDLWGTLRLNQTASIPKVAGNLLEKVNARFNRKRTRSLRIDIPRSIIKRKRRSLYGEILDTRKKICYYYGGLTKTEYRKLNVIADLKGGDFSENMLTLLEFRLCTLVHRMNFCNTILESIHLVLSGCVLVNKKVIKRPSYNVQVGDIVELHNLYKENRFNNLVHNLKCDKLLAISPGYLEINYTILSGIPVRKPNFNEVPYTFKFERDFFTSEFRGKY